MTSLTIWKCRCKTCDKLALGSVCGHTYLNIDKEDSSLSLFPLAKVCLAFASFNAILRA